MPNRSTDPLFQLIKSLEKSEKRNFKLFVKRNSSSDELKSIQLFDAMDRMNEYDEAMLLRKNPSISKTQISNLKAQLYRQVLGSLRIIKDENNVDLQLHELLTYLNHRGVLTLMVLAQQGLIGQMSAPVDLTYLADTVILKRYFEAAGKVRQAISVVKKRSGRHERSLREYTLDHEGFHVGEPLVKFHGILTGTPNFIE